MTNKEFARMRRDWTANLRLLPGLMCLGLLAGCGGGGSGSDTATAQDATKQIAAVVPGSWTGRVPGSEVINGITVPPEPSPTLNNATLAGVDANKNGVRDDVERVIAAKLGGSNDFPRAIAYANFFQRILTNDTLSQSTLIDINKQTACIDIAIKSDFDGPKIKLLLANTEERRSRLRSILSTFGGQIISDDVCSK